jgi:integration host factor subunit beta
MVKSELIAALHEQSHLSHRDVELAVGVLLDHMSQTLAQRDRIEIRGFGSFSLNYLPPRRGRNPATGDAVDVQARYAPRFRPSKELRERVMAI